MPDLGPAIELIARYVERQMEQDGVPGLALAVTDRERTLCLATYGYANLDSREPLAPGHLFAIGSITKSMAAIAALQLHDEGRLDLHAPLTDYLPWFEARSEFEPITIHHLLTHTSGLVGIDDLLMDKLYDVWRLRYHPVFWAPGQRYYYSNVAYKALTLALERVDGRDFGAIVRARIFEPLGLTQSEPVTTHDMRQRLATGYLHFFDDRPWLPHHGMAPAEWWEIATGDGCVAMPPAELAAYLRALLNRGRGLLSEAAFDLMAAKHAEVEPDHWYGYGLDIDVMDGHRTISHGGEMPGYQCFMLADLDTGLGFILQSNGVTSLFSAALFARTALAAAMEGEPLPELPPLADRRDIEQAEALPGSYQASGLDGKIFELLAFGDQLFMQYQGERVPVWQGSEGGLVADHPDFNRLPLCLHDEAGRVLRHGGRLYSRLDGPVDQMANAEPRPPIDERGSLEGHYRTFMATLRNFRIVESPGGALLLVHPGGKEETLQRLDESTWRVEDTPETIRFDTFVDSQALHASFTGCDYYRTFTP
jgi:CubicO group peptidase (beta-lactamase class C family)